MAMIKMTPNELLDLSSKLNYTSGELMELKQRIGMYLQMLQGLQNHSDSSQKAILKAMESLNQLSDLAKQLEIISSENSAIASQFQEAEAAIFKDI